MDIYSGLLAAYMAAIVGMIVVGVLVYVVTAFFLSKVFAKAGVQGTWRAWAPVYNLMVFFKLGDLSPWLVLYCFGGAVLLSWIGIGFLFSLALFAGSGVAAYRIGMKLGKEPAFVALWLIPPAWLGVVAYGKQTWNTNVAPAQWAGNAFLGDRTVWDGVPAQSTVGSGGFAGNAGGVAGSAGAPGMPEQPAGAES
ncbi:large exoprotein [Microbacterium sp. A93]|uniref:large exoprotein n=1 Tax=Microbacterium sp. A93 TaxID=3450716 RepID=UPI003F43E3EA